MLRCLDIDVPLKQHQHDNTSTRQHLFIALQLMKDNRIILLIQW